MAMELGVVVFEHEGGADSALGGARAAGAAWASQAALVEHRRRHDRITLIGTILGRYVSADERDHVSQSGAAVGSILGGILGMPLGPPGAAAGIVLGGAVGAEAGHADETEAEPRALADDLRAAVPKGASAVLLIGPAEHVAAMVDDLGAAGDAHRRPLGAEETAALETALAQAPPASPGPDADGAAGA
jgi:uncharacterized membrane protein